MRTVRVNETIMFCCNAPLYMQSIQVGSTMVAEIMYAKWLNTLAARELKGLTQKIITQCTMFHEILSSCKMFVGATVIKFHFFNQIINNTVRCSSNHGCYSSYATCTIY